MRGHYVSIWQSPEYIYIHIFFFVCTISGDDASYFLEMNMLTSLNGTLCQTGVGVGKVSRPSKGPMRGKYALRMAKFQICDRFCFQLVLLEAWHLFP